MDPAESAISRQIFIKGLGAEILSEFWLWDSFKDSAPPRALNFLHQDNVFFQ